MTTESAEDHWMPDKLCHECSNCNIKFSILVRRHHCRVCGRIYCNACSNHTIPGHLLRSNLKGNVRVCLACERIFYEVISTRQFQNPLPSSTQSQSLLIGSEALNDPEVSISSVNSNSFTTSVISNRHDYQPNEADLVSSPSRTTSGIGIEFDNPTPHRYATIRKSSLPAENDENILALAEVSTISLYSIYVLFRVRMKLS